MNEISIVSISNNNKSELLTNFQNLSIKRRINETYQLSTIILKTEKNKHSYPLVQDDSVISLEQDFTIKNMTEGPNSKSITALHSFFDCIGDFVDEKYPEGLYTLQRVMEIAFSNSDWGFEIVGIGNDISDMCSMSEFGEDNVISILNQALESFDVEYDVDSHNKTVLIFKRLGVLTDFQIRYRHNIKTISRTIDSENVFTAVKVYYNRDEYGNYNSSLIYESPRKDNYPKVKWMKPLYLDSIVSPEQALAQTKLYLTDMPTVSFKVELVELQRAGYNSDDVQLGNTVFLIDERMNLDGEARIVEIERFPFDKGRSPIISISNVRNKITDRIVQQKKEQQVLDKSAVKQRVIYNGCTITPEDGFKATAQNGVVTFLNATEGIAIINNGVYKFYVNTDGELILDGRLKITGNGHTLFDGYLDENGGKLDIFDVDGKLNVRIGSNYYKSNTTGGALTLYSDGDDVEHERVESYIDKDSDTGALVLRGRNGVRRLNVNATSSDNEMTIAIADVDGRVKSMFSETYGIINGDEIVTKSVLDTAVQVIKEYVDEEISDLREYVNEEIDWLWSQIPDGE